MIALTTMGGHKLLVNPQRILTVEALNPSDTGDCIVWMDGGVSYQVKESAGEVGGMANGWYDIFRRVE